MPCALHILCWAGLWLSSVAAAAGTGPVVIHEAGPTKPIADYLNGTVQPPGSPPPRSPEGLARTAPAEPVLPVRTPALAPGPVAAKSLRLPQLVTPLFVIGSDAASRRWLTEHRQRLGELGAVGLLVQAETAQDLEAMRRLAGGLHLVAADGSELARAVGLTHYPALISSRGIEP